jgi:hypothetical protein
MKKTVILLLLQFLIFNNNHLHAQWMQTNGPYGGTILSFAKNDTGLFIGNMAVYSSQVITVIIGLLLIMA